MHPFRKLTTALILCLLFFLSAQLGQALPVVTSVTVSGNTYSNWRYGGTTAKLRVYASNTFTQSGTWVIGSRRGSGQWYQEVSCTVAGNVLTIPSFVLQVTTTSSDTASSYTFIFVDSKGTEREVYLGEIKVPDTFGATVSWDQLYLFNTQRTTRRSDYEVYNKDQVNALIGAVLPAAKATTTVNGIGKVSVTPVDATNPVFVGKNDVATTTNVGIGKVSVTPVDAANPILVGTNDQRVQPVTTIMGTDHTADFNDCGRLLAYLTTSSPRTLTLPYPGLAVPCVIDVQNSGVSNLTITSAAIDNGNSFVLFPGTGARLYSAAGTGWYTLRGVSPFTTELTPRQFGARADGSSHTISSGDVAAHTEWVKCEGVYVVGDEWDYVASQEAICAAFYNSTATPNDSNYKLNRPLHFTAGNYNFGAKGLKIKKLRGGLVYGDGLLTTTLTSSGVATLTIDGLWYSSFRDMTISGSGVYAGGVVEVDGNRAGPGTSISEQYTTWQMVQFNANNVVADAFRLNVNGAGSGQGDGNRFANCRWAQGTVSGYHQLGSNTLSNQIVGGDIQGCPIGIWLDTGSTAYIDGMVFENGAGTDVVITGGVTNSVSGIYNSRSESKTFLTSTSASGPVTVANVEAMGYGWSGYSTWTLNTVVTTAVYTIGDGRLFKVTTAGTTGGTEPNWDSCASDGGTIADGTAVWTQQEWNIVNVNHSSISNSVFGLGRVQQNWGSGNAGSRNTMRDVVVTRVDWSGNTVGQNGGWLALAATQNFQGVQVRKVTPLLPQWQLHVPVAYGNHSQSGAWSAGIRALQPTSVNPFFMGEAATIYSKAAVAGSGYADVGTGHAGPDTGGFVSSASVLNESYNTQNALAVWGTISAGRIPSGSNQQGQDLRIQGGPSTGNLGSGSVKLRTGAAGASGTQVNDTLDRLVITYLGLTSLYKGANVASAAAIVPSGNLFHITGTTNITSITSTDIMAGTRIAIIFDGVLTFTDGNNLKLAGNFVTTADDTIVLEYDGTNWYEASRSIN